MSRISAIIEGCRPSVGSSRRRTRGLGAERAGDGEHLLLAAGEGAGDLGQALAQAREEGEGAVAGGGAVAAGHQADLEVLGDGELGEEPAALRDPGDAVARDLVGGQGVEAGGVEA